MIRAVDMGIEQVYNAAQQLLDRETIIIFASDNGAQPTLKTGTQSRKRSSGIKNKAQGS